MIMTNDGLSYDESMIKQAHKLTKRRVIWKNAQSCKIKTLFLYKDPVIIQYTFE